MKFRSSVTRRCNPARSKFSHNLYCAMVPTQRPLRLGQQLIPAEHAAVTHLIDSKQNEGQNLQLR